MNIFNIKNLIALSFTISIISLTVFSLSFAQEFPNPLQYDTMEEVLTVILDRLRGIIAIISIIFIVIGGLLYMTSAGNESRMTMAKGAILASIIGLAIGIAAPSFVLEIYTALGSTSVPAAASGPTISEIAMNVLNFLLGIIGIIAIIMLVAAGMMYLTAAGSESRIETAKNMTKWSIVGITIALASLIIVKQIASFFN